MRTLATTIPFDVVDSDVVDSTSVLFLRDLVFALFHIPLALVMFKFQAIATLHAWITIVATTYVALRSGRPEPLMYMCGYVLGSEVLWRMTSAQALYHLGKYLTAWILMIGLYRFRSTKLSISPLIYFLFLLPSAIVTILQMHNYPDIKEALSYNLSGPFVFTISALFFSRLWISKTDVQRTFFLSLPPALGVCAVTLYATYSANAIRFITESNWETSAGYNPAAVSGVLGLAALLCFLLFLLNRTSRFSVRGILIAGWVLFTVESVMTFSRQGLYMEVGGIMVALYYLYRTRGLRAQLLLFLGFILTAFLILVVPRLDVFTSGKFTERFLQTDTTHRDTLIYDDLNTFKDNFVLGVGPGRSEQYRSIGYYKAHTEYSRLFSEHGIFGIFALILLFLMLFRRWEKMEASNFLLAPTMAYGLLFLAVNATRHAAPVFLLGLTFVTIISDEERPSIAQTK